MPARRKPSKPRIGIDGTPINAPRFRDAPHPVGPIESGSIVWGEIRRAIEAQNKRQRPSSNPTTRKASTRQNKNKQVKPKKR